MVQKAILETKSLIPMMAHLSTVVRANLFQTLAADAERHERRAIEAEQNFWRGKQATYLCAASAEPRVAKVIFELSAANIESSLFHNLCASLNPIKSKL